MTSAQSQLARRACGARAGRRRANRQADGSLRVRPRLLGLVTFTHLLKARKRHLEEERRRERVLRLDLLLPAALRSVRRTAIGKET
jgi:hypothetical protein